MFIIKLFLKVLVNLKTISAYWNKIILNNYCSNIVYYFIIIIDNVMTKLFKNVKNKSDVFYDDVIEIK